MNAHMEIKPCVSWLLMTYIRIFVAQIEIYYSGKDTQTKRIFFICVMHAHAIPDSSCRHLRKSSIYKSSTPGFTNCWCVKRSYNCLPGRVIPHDPDFLYKLHKIQSDEKTKYTMYTYIRSIELAVKREGRKWKKKRKKLKAKTKTRFPKNKVRNSMFSEQEVSLENVTQTSSTTVFQFRIFCFQSYFIKILLNFIA